MAAARSASSTPRKAPAKKASARKKAAASKKATKRAATPPAKQRGQHGGQRPGAGRPPIDLHATIDRNDEGAAVSMLDRIAEQYRLGGFDKDAAARVGIDVATLREWQKVGARAQRDLADGSRTLTQLSPHERQLVELVDVILRATSEARTLGLGLVNRAIRGGHEVTSRKVKRDGHGNIIETTVTTEQAQSDNRVLTWWMSRRWPEDFGSRVEISGPDGGPVPIAVESPVDKLRETLDRIAKQHADHEQRRHDLGLDDPPSQ